MAEDRNDRRRALRLDKAFPVFVSGDRGVSFGVARNISEEGMFIETLDNEALGSKLQVTFVWPGANAEITAEAEVRYTSVLNYGPKGERHAVQGIGVRFLRFLLMDEYEHPPPDPGALH